MSLAALRTLAGEAASVGSTLRGELEQPRVGPVVVSGMLAEQLAKQLAVDAEPDAIAFVTEGLPPLHAEVIVHVIAGDPTAEDEALVRAADAHGTPIVLVQLWPQAEWGRPFVLSPFVVECEAGEGFPVSEIGARILEAAENETVVAARVPLFERLEKRNIVKGALIRTTALGLVPPRNEAARPLISLVQAGMLARLHTASGGSAALTPVQVLAGTAAVVVGTGFVFRSMARVARGVLPRPIADAGVAAAGTWALAKGLEVAEQRLEPDSE